MWKYLCKKGCGNNVLELASGTGRISIPLLREGFKVTGLELSQTFCEASREKAITFQPNGKFIQGDISNFDLKEKFDTVFVGYNSFLHLLKNKDGEACLKSVKKHLKKDSRFYIDIYMPSPLHYYRPKNVRYPTIEYFDSQINEEVLIEETNNYDPDREVNQLTWFYSSKTKKDFLTNTFSTRMYWPDTMNRLLIEAGFEILNIWGNYSLKTFSEESTLQIFELKI
jgi:SAM-dependent methyltransferase